MIYPQVSCELHRYSKSLTLGEANIILGGICYERYFLRIHTRLANVFSTWKQISGHKYRLVLKVSHNIVVNKEKMKKDVKSKNLI